MRALSRWALAASFTIAIASAVQAKHEADPGTGPAKQKDEQSFKIEVPLRDGKFVLGDVVVRIVGDRTDIERRSFCELAGQILRAEVVERVGARADGDGYLSLARIAETGLKLRLEPSTLTLYVEPEVEQRKRGSVSLAYADIRLNQSDLAKRAKISGFINMHGGITRTDSQDPRAALSFDGALRVLDVVVEAEGTFVDGSFARRGTRLLYDDPDRALRSIAGDITPNTTGFQRGGSLFGVSLEKSYGKLQPQQNIRPTGRGTFRLERPSEVDILVNGRVVRRLQLNAGDYDLNDLPLRTGENNVELRITDDTGQQRILNFSLFFDRSLLAPGISEWSIAAGVRSGFHLGSFAYEWERPAVTGFYRVGLLDFLTGEFHGQMSEQGLMAGAIFTYPSSLGLISAEAAASVTAAGQPGFGLTIDFFRDRPLETFGLGGSLRLSGEFQSPEFYTLFEDETSSGFTQLNAAYSMELAEGLSASVGARARYSEQNDFGVNLSLTRSLRPDLTWTLSASYDSAWLDSYDGGSGFSLQGRLNIRLGESSGLNVHHDFASRSTDVSVHRSDLVPGGVLSTGIEFGRDPGGGTGRVEGALETSVAFSGQRGDLSFDHSRRFQGLGSETVVHNTSLRGSAALAFADGHFAFGRPVSDSFAIITAHPTLEDATIGIGDPKRTNRPESGFLGPALVSDIPSYTPLTFSVDVNGAPEGYDLGSGLVAVYAHRKSGTLVRVGTDFSMSAVGMLQDEDGQPVALLTGEMHPEGEEEHKVEVFTNRKGRFSAQGIKPGPWILRMASFPETCFKISVPEGKEAFFDAGVLRPSC